MGGFLGAQIKTTTQRLTRSEEKQFAARRREDPEVLAELHRNIYAEEDVYVKRRIEHVRYMNKVKETKKAADAGNKKQTRSGRS